MKVEGDRLETRFWKLGFGLVVIVLFGALAMPTGFVQDAGPPYAASI